MMQPFTIKNPTPEVLALQKQLSEVLDSYIIEKKISYDECMGKGRQLALQILQEATKKNDN